MGFLKGKSKKKSIQGTYIGKFKSNEKEIKEMDLKIKAQEELLAAKKRKFEEIMNDIAEVDREIDRATKRKRYSEGRLQQVNLQLDQVKSTLTMKKQDLRSKFQVKFSSVLAHRRQALPTSSTLNHTATIIRRKELMACCKVIHGASEVDMGPAYYGMLDTLGAKQSKKKLVDDIQAILPGVARAIQNAGTREWVKSYNASPENMSRSLNIYYSHCPAGKLKYIAMRRAGRGRYRSMPLINLVPYRKLAKFMRDVCRHQRCLGYVSKIY